MLKLLAKRVLPLIIFSATSLCAESETPPPPPQPQVHNSINYVGLGLGPFPIPLPNFALGHRIQHNHHGADFSLQATTIVWITQVKASALYHYYFNPNLSSQFYAGTGLGFSWLSASYGCISPEFVFGKHYTNEAHDQRFFQAQVSWPTFGGWRSSSHGHMLYMPLVVFSYGVCF